VLVLLRARTLLFSCHSVEGFDLAHQTVCGTARLAPPGGSGTRMAISAGFAGWQQTTVEPSVLRTTVDF
jgi:hypothetical protein